MTKRIQKKIEFLAKPIKTSQANNQTKPISKPKTKPIKPNQANIQANIQAKN